MPAGVTLNISRNGILLQWTAAWVPAIGSRVRLYIDPPAATRDARSFRCHCRVVRLALSDGGPPEVAVAVAQADFRGWHRLTERTATEVVQ